MSNIVANKEDLKQFKHNHIVQISEKAKSFKNCIDELKSIEDEIDIEIQNYKDIIERAKYLIKNVEEEVKRTNEEIEDVNKRINELKNECILNPKKALSYQIEINQLKKELIKLKTKKNKLESLIPKINSNISFDNAKLTHLNALKKKISNFQNDLRNNIENIISITKKGDNTISNADKSLQKYCNTSLKVNNNFVESSNRQYDTSKYFKPDIDKMIGLSYQEQTILSNEYNFSSSICSYIRDIKEAEIYKNQNLEEIIIDGKPCLSAYKNINYDLTDSWGLTNLERMKLGLAPIDDTGTPYELNRIGQRQDSPFAELPKDQHTGKKNNFILHTTRNVKSKVDHITNYPIERKNHWIYLSGIVENFRKENK